MGTFSVRRSAFGSRRGGRPGGCFPRREALGGHPQRPGSRKRLPSKACQGRVLTLDILRHANAGSFAYIAAFFACYGFMLALRLPISSWWSELSMRAQLCLHPRPHQSQGKPQISGRRRPQKHPAGLLPNRQSLR
jgi:hypothetical protein